jgi:hypothetical protein
MEDFGASDDAEYAAAVINGDIPDIQLPNDIFDDEESDDENNLGTLKQNIIGDNRLESGPAVMNDGDVSVAGVAPKKKRQPRPKLDANVLCSEKYGLGALLKRSKHLIETEKLSSESGHELHSLRKIMSLYRSFARESFGVVDPPTYYEKCEKLGGGSQVRSLMEMLRFRVTNPEDGMDSEDDDWGDSNAGMEGVEYGSSSSSSSSSLSNNNSIGNSVDNQVSKMSDEQLRERIAKNRAAAMERLAQRNAEKLAEAEKAAAFTARLASGQGNVSKDSFLGDDDDDDALLGAIDLEAIEKQVAEKKKLLQEEVNSQDMLELSDDEDGLEIEIEKVAAEVVGSSQSSQSQDFSQLRFEESQEFQTQSQVQAP